jgi:hypothetical protein
MDGAWIMQTEMADDFVPPSASLTVHKATAYQPISLELAMDYGLITEEQARAQGWTPPPPPPPVPFRLRLRLRLSSLREWIGRKVGGWIAGVDLSERDDDY